MHLKLVLVLLAVFVLLACADAASKKKSSSSSEKKGMKGLSQEKAVERMQQLVDRGDNELRQNKDVQKAVENYDRAIDALPNHPRPHFKRAMALMASEEDDSFESFNEALRLFDSNLEFVKATEKYPENLRHDILNNMAIILTNKNRHAEALQRLRESHRDIPLPRSYGNFVTLSQALCEWKNWDEIMSNMEQIMPSKETFISPSSAILFPFNATLINYASKHVSFISDLQVSKVSPQPNLALHPPLTAKTALRIAFITAQLGGTAVSRSLAAVIANPHHRISPFVFAIGSVDTTSAETTIIREVLVDRVLNSHKQTPTEVAIDINKNRIRILIDLDGHSSTMFDHRSVTSHQVLSFKPAQFQVYYPMMYPSSLMANRMHIFADKIAIPPEHRFYYSEKMIYLPRSFLVQSYTHPIMRKMYSLDKKSTALRGDYSLPRRGAVLASFNSQVKLDPQTFTKWLQISDRVADSVLWVLAFRSEASDAIHKWVQAQGYDITRVVPAGVVDYVAHMGRAGLASLHLDARPSSASTGMDMLWRGVPFVTHAGARLAERTCASLAYFSDRSEYIARTNEEYVEVAARLASIRKLKEVYVSDYDVFNTTQFSSDFYSSIRMLWELSDETDSHIIASRR